MLVVQGLSLPIAWDRVAEAASWAQSEAPERASEVLYTQALLWGGRFHCVGHTGVADSNVLDHIVLMNSHPCCWNFILFLL